MDLTKLFEMQKTLDERIIKEHGLEGIDLLSNKILALQVELGECANEWQGFKHWKKDNSPKKYYDSIMLSDGVELVPYTKVLEEYVDCLHFFLSIGLEVHCTFKAIRASKTTGITDQFILVFDSVGDLSIAYTNDRIEYYEEAFKYFIGLGEMLGFTWEQIEQAYVDKNKVNHERQDNGY